MRRTPESGLVRFQGGKVSHQYRQRWAPLARNGEFPGRVISTSSRVCLPFSHERRVFRAAHRIADILAAAKPDGVRGSETQGKRIVGFRPDFGAGTTW
jgi:hypothetical protein